MVIAIDFDGTIVEHAFPEIGALKKGVKETITKWYNSGHKIIIWTCRNDDTDEKYESAAKAFLDEIGIPYHTINKNINEETSDFVPRKVFAHLYIDDRGIRFNDNWEELGYLIN